MSLDVIELESGPNPTATLIILHGLGADGNDFVPVADELDLSRVGPVRFIFPHAPTRPITINGGHVMRAWYDIAAPDLVQREDEAGLRQSQLAIEALIANERARGMPARRIVLAGFSQGCAMTLMTGLRHAERLAGLVCMSGYLPLAARLEAERDSANHDVPIFLAHGLTDQMIPMSRSTPTRECLQRLGYPVETHDYPMGHSVCAQEISDLNRWLLRVLA
jgi:phospholipase/carboxylesterase